MFTWTWLFALVSPISTRLISIYSNTKPTRTCRFSSSFIKFSLKWIQNSNTLNVCLFNLVSNLKHDKKKPNWIEAINFRFWSAVFVPFQYTDERRSVIWASKPNRKHIQTLIICAVTWFALFFLCPLTHIQTSSKQYQETNGHVHARTCRYLQFIWQLTWISMRYTMIKWLIPMHSLNDCEISMLQSEEFFFGVRERNGRKKENKPTSKSWNGILICFYDTHTHNAYHTNLRSHTHTHTHTHMYRIWCDLFYTAYNTIFTTVIYSLYTSSKFLSFKPFVDCHNFLRAHTFNSNVVFSVFFFRLCIESKTLYYIFFLNAEQKNPNKTNKQNSYELSHARYILPDLKNKYQIFLI